MAIKNQQVRKVFQTPAFRLSYPALFEAIDTRMNKTGVPTAKDLKFGCTMLFPKSTTVAALKAARHPASTWMSEDNGAALWQTIQQVARGNFGPERDLTTLKLTKFHDGDKPRPTTGKMDDNAQGYIWVKTTSRDKPTLLRQDKTVIVDPAELYAGCWVRAVLTVAPFTMPEHGVTLYLAGIQKLADDQTFSSRPRVEDEFDAVAAEGQGFMAPTTPVATLPPGYGLPGGGPAPVTVSPFATPAAPKQPWEV